MEPKGGKQGFNPTALPLFRREERSDIDYNDFYQFVVEMAADEVFLMTSTSEIVYVNRSACKKLGYKQDELVGLHVWEWDPLFPKEVWPGFWEEFVESKHLHFETQHKTKKGIVFPVEIHAHYFVKNGEGFLLALVNDLTEKKRSEQELYHHANYDQLTNLPNRYFTMDRLKHAISQADRAVQKLAVMFMDLNKFKNINDIHGHAIGDLVLKDAAKRILESVRQSDTVGRLGGDEFIVILEIASDDHIKRVAEHLCNAFRKPFHFETYELYATASIGIAIYPDHTTDAETLITKADIAMYAAKNSGTDTYRFYED